MQGGRHPGSFQKEEDFSKKFFLMEMKKVRALAIF
jgi:hypothetical protein